MVPAPQRSQPPPRHPPTREILQTAAWAAAIAAVYFAAAKLGLRLAFVNASATPVWPPTGIALAAVLVLGARVWPGVFAGAFLANVTTAGNVATSLGIAAGNTLEAVAGGFLVRRFAGGVHAFERARDVVRFVVLAALAATTLSATFGVTSLALGGFAAWSDYGAIWATWWLGDVAGAMLVAPPLLLWASRSAETLHAPRVLEAAVLAAAIAGVSLVVFGGVLPPRWEANVLPTFALPLLAWAAVRFGAREASTALAALAGVAVWGTIHGHGPYARDSPNESLLLLQAFLSVSATTVLLLAAVVHERRRAELSQRARLRREEAARRDADHQRRRVGLLAEVSRQLAVSLDPDRRLASVARLLVPELGDACLIHRRGADGSASLAASAHRDPARAAALHEALGRHPPDPAATRGIPRVLATGRAEAADDADDALVPVGLRDEKNHPPAWRDGPTRALVVPLPGREGVLGTLTLLAGPWRGPWGPDDVAFAEDVARRAATAVENAWLYAEARDAEGSLRRLNEELDERVHARTGELEAANRELQSFTYCVSHDLRTPLRTIDGFSQVLLEDAGDRLGADGRDALQRIRNATRHMAGLIDDLLTLSRVQDAPLDREPVDLSELARAVALGLSEREPDRHVTVSVAPGLTATGDARLLRVVLENLLGNAWKFTARRPRARIDVGESQAGGGSVFFVRDDGVGFDMAHAGRLFRPFERLHRASEFEGTGVGLASVQRIVRRHGGRAWAESSPGAGATFYFTLGPAAAREVTADEHETDPRGGGQPGRRGADPPRAAAPAPAV